MRIIIGTGLNLTRHVVMHPNRSGYKIHFVPLDDTKISAIRILIPANKIRKRSHVHRHWQKIGNQEIFGGTLTLNQERCAVYHFWNSQRDFNDKVYLLTFHRPPIQFKLELAAGGIPTPGTSKIIDFNLKKEISECP
jgi:hypothetical protein